MKRILLASVGFAVIAGLGTASAADLSRQYYKAPPPYVAPINNWTGIYLGVNGGGGWGSSHWDALGRGFDVSGGVIGGTVGYNWQFGTWVVGLEGDIDASNIKDSTSCFGVTCETKNDFLSTIRGRVGYAFDRWLPYATGGVAIGNIKASSPGTSTVDETNVGWTLGVGMEYAFTPNWSAKVEYLHVDLGNISCGVGTACISTIGNRTDFSADLVRGGINFRF